MDGEIQKSKKYLSIEDFLIKNKEKIIKYSYIIISVISALLISIGLILTLVFFNSGVKKDSNEVIGNFSLSDVRENNKSLHYKIINFDSSKNYQNIELQIDVSNDSNYSYTLNIDDNIKSIYKENENYVNNGFDLNNLTIEEFIINKFNLITNDLFFATRNDDTGTNQHYYLNENNLLRIDESGTNNYQIYNDYGLLIEGYIEDQYQIAAI